MQRLHSLRSTYLSNPARVIAARLGPRRAKLWRTTLACRLGQLLPSRQCPRSARLRADECSQPFDAGGNGVGLCCRRRTQLIREIYMPGTSENKDAEVEETILRALAKVGIRELVRWRDLYRTCHLDRKGVVIANRVRENMKRNGVIGWDDRTKHIWRME
jgi:hypothetical protein